jgi:hypothetical protein
MCSRSWASGPVARASRQRSASTAARCSLRPRAADGRVMTGQAAQGIEGPHRGRYAGSSACLDGNASRPGRPRADRRARRRGAEAYGQHRRTGLCRPGIHRSECRRSRPTTRHSTRGRQASHGKTRIRAAAPPMGRRTKLRLGSTLQKTRQRLRKTLTNTQRNTLHRIRHPHDHKTYQTRNFITPSRRERSGKSSRRLYCITAFGQRALKTAKKRVRELFEEQIVALGCSYRIAGLGTGRSNCATGRFFSVHCYRGPRREAQLSPDPRR